MLRSAQFLKCSGNRSSGISGLQDLKPTGLPFEILGSSEEQLLDLGILRAHRKLAAMLCLRTEFVGVDDLHVVQALGQTGRSNGRRKCPQPVETADPDRIPASQRMPLSVFDKLGLMAARSRAAFLEIEP